MQNKKYMITIAVLAALLMGAIGVIAGMMMQQKMNRDPASAQTVESDVAQENVEDAWVDEKDVTSAG